MKTNPSILTVTRQLIIKVWPLAHAKFGFPSEQMYAIFQTFAYVFISMFGLLSVNLSKFVIDFCQNFVIICPALKCLNAYDCSHFNIY